MTLLVNPWNPERKNWNSYLLDLCDVVASRATCNRGPKLRLFPGRTGVGCVIVSPDKRILATGYNGSPSREIHCETVRCISCGWSKPATIDTPCMDGTECPQCHMINTVHGGHILENGHCTRSLHAEWNAIADAARRGIALEGTSLVCNCYPCWICAKIIVSAGITTVYYEHPYQPDTRVENLLKDRLIQVQIAK